MLITANKLKINVKGSPISRKTVKLLGVTVDNKLSFELHPNLVFIRVSQKLHALAIVSMYISKKAKLRVIMKAFVMSQFRHGPLVWMCHSRTLNNKINELHERALWLVYDDSSQHSKNYLT